MVALFAKTLCYRAMPRKYILGSEIALRAFVKQMWRPLSSLKGIYFSLVFEDSLQLYIKNVVLRRGTPAKKHFNLHSTESETINGPRIIFQLIINLSGPPGIAPARFMGYPWASNITYSM